MEESDARASTVRRRQACSAALLFVGMTFLWNCFRYQSFLGVVYPWELEAAPGVSAYALFIAVLCALTVAALAVLGRRDLSCPPWVVCAVGALGSVGVALSLACRSEGPELALPVACVSTCLVAASFLTGYLAWASLCVRCLSAGTAAVMAASFFASTVLGGLVSRAHPGAPEAFALLGPALVGLAFCLAWSRMPVPDAPCDSRRPVVSAPVVLFVAFLLMGAVVRGVVDVSGAGLPVGATVGFRWPLSVGVSLAVFAACLGLYLASRLRPDWFGDGFRPVMLVSFGAWVVLAALFCVGVFWGLACGSYGEAGQVVIVARSTLSFVLWLFLCVCVRSSGSSPARSFALYGMLTEVVSWVLSYGVVPHLLAYELGGSRSAQDVLALFSLLALMLTLVAALGWAVIRRGLADAGVSASGASVTGQAAAPSVPGGFPPERVAFYRLTPRESEVAWLFAQGNSIKSIASTLRVSTGTAQGHIRGAYRKFGVHSRDELIALVRSWK